MRTSASISTAQKVLVYDMMPYITEIRDCYRTCNDANETLRLAEKSFVDFLAATLGVKTEDLTFTNICCIAEGIPHHVYLRRKCVFCDCLEDDCL